MPSIRMLDQSRIGAILTGDDDALLGGPPVTAMLIQNTNPVSVAPDQETGQARLCPRRSVRLRARAVHDRHRQNGRCRPAGHHVRRARRLLHGRRQPIHSAWAEADRPARRMPIEPRSDLRAGQAARRRASGLRHDAARIDRCDAAEIRLGHAGGSRSQPLDRLPAGLCHRALSQRLCLSRRQIPLQAGLADACRSGAGIANTRRRQFRSCPTIGK